MLRLYSHPLSTYARRVRIALIEKFIPHEIVDVDLAARAHRAPDYLKLNPYGRVPTIVDDGFVLHESNAILMYLEDQHPEPALIPGGAKARAEVDMHLRLCDAEFARHAGTIIFPKRFLPEAKWDTAAIAKASTEISRHLAILSQRLHSPDRDYLVHDLYSLADIAYIPFLEFLPLMVDLATVPPNVLKWRELLLARQSSVETAPAK